MVDSINFVREQRRRLTKQQQQDVKIFRMVGMAGVAVLILVLVSVGVQVFLNFQVQAIINQQNTQLAIIQAQSENERSYVTFAAKIQSLSELFTNRRNKQEAIAYFSTLFDDSVLINGISYRAADNELTFGVQTQNVFSLNRVVEILNTPEVKSHFKAISYEELTRSENGEYQTKVIVVLNSDT